MRRRARSAGVQRGSLREPEAEHPVQQRTGRGTIASEQAERVSRPYSELDGNTDA